MFYCIPAFSCVLSFIHLIIKLMVVNRHIYYILNNRCVFILIKEKGIVLNNTFLSALWLLYLILCQNRLMRCICRVDCRFSLLNRQNKRNTDKEKYAEIQEDIGIGKYHCLLHDLTFHHFIRSA